MLRELRGVTPTARAQIARIQREVDDHESDVIVPIMYGASADDIEEGERLEALRLANERERLEIERLRQEIEQDDDAKLLDRILVLAKAAKAVAL
ncbi:hypothetical protein [Novosphingobium sp. PhB55]|uniref:hypothetical protein n=1 Tax=Novosphingobium sp. PhB55 TaxID=2485106 RepID=UPI001066EFA5|nr:hypothetical protein [Novosphingobium sp. PhB55]